MTRDKRVHQSGPAEHRDLVGTAVCGSRPKPDLRFYPCQTKGTPSASRAQGPHAQTVTRVTRENAQVSAHAGSQ